jgi:hypothetical protein
VVRRGLRVLVCWMLGRVGPPPRGSAPIQLQEQTRALAVLRVDRRDLDARHRTLEATIGWSYDLLDARLQELFRQVSVFRGGFTVDAATVVGADGEDPSGMADSLDALVSRSLLTVDRSQRNRFRMLDVPCSPRTASPMPARLTRHDAVISGT